MKLNKELTHVTQPSINSSSDLNNEVAKFNCNIVIALSNATKSVKTKERPIKLPPDVKAMIKIKVKLQRLFSNTQNQLTKNNINNINNKIKKVTLRLRHEKWNSTFATLIDSKPSEKQFLNKLKTQTESAEALPNSTLNSDEKVETFAKHFEQAFTTNYKSKPKQSLFKYYTTNKHNTPISNTELDKAISNLKNTNSKGLDGISNKIIKNSNEINKNYVLQLFNHSLDLHHVPPAWKSAKIILIHKKKSDPDLLQSVQHISYSLTQNRQHYYP
ncbi:RNA-directed DNA polymerase from transposon X [Brachionus plicatilis]|uniref:RNA-directed DNA polymerase from transposon X n=1 Tax=Brachionus plicatilis TaxID=10195 RepID=A0A3M7QLU6_BRAPC|nr:RNA-directed DNA polymerase from transposon X [Brachionus plicatilis]